MPSRKRLFEEYRERALQSPRTRANAPVWPDISLPGGVFMGLSVNL